MAVDVSRVGRQSTRTGFFRSVRNRTVQLSVLIALLVGNLVSLPVNAPSAFAVTATKRWERVLPAGVFQSSPGVDAIKGNGIPVVVIGATNGKLYAMSGNTGSDLAGWPVQTKGKKILSSPSMADTNHTRGMEVFVGSGATDGGVAATPGGFYSIDYNGKIRWRVSADDPAYKDHSVFATLAIGDNNHDGSPDVFGGNVGLAAWSIRQDGHINPHWPQGTDDSIFSSPALLDVNHNGYTDIVTGGDTTPGSYVDYQGGILRAYSGSTGKLIWYKFFDEMFRSSPSVGDITGDGIPEIAIGSGDYWWRVGGARDASLKFRVLQRDGSIKWTKNLGAFVMSSPTIADVDGDGKRDVIISTWDDPNGGGDGGRVWVFDGSGHTLPHWAGRVSGGGGVEGEVVTADLDNDGAQDLLVPTGSGVQVYSGATGASMFALGGGTIAYRNSAWVGDIDNDGNLDIVVGGTRASDQKGVVQRFEISGGTLGARGWPTYRHDSRRTGNASPVDMRQ